MSVDTLPVVGAALPVSALTTHSKCLLEKQRDLELQGFFACDDFIGGNTRCRSGRCYGDGEYRRYKPPTST